VAATLVVLAPGIASAQLAATKERVLGLGGGGAIGTEQTSAGTEHTFIQLLNLELRVPVSPRFELGLHLPLTSMLYANRFDADVNAFVWADAFVTWYPMRDAGGLFISPGLGAIYGSTDNASGYAIEIPARFGWETSTRSFGRALAVRPWVDVVFPSGNVDTGTRYGVVFELTLIGYSTRAQAVPVVARE
jgi:hypothetical protein